MHLRLRTLVDDILEEQYLSLDDDKLVIFLPLQDLFGDLFNYFFILPKIIDEGVDQEADEDLLINFF